MNAIESGRPASSTAHFGWSRCRTSLAESRLSHSDLAAFGAEVGLGCAAPLACDVTDPAQVADAVRQAEAALGPVERLICSAGGGEKTRIEAFSTDHVQRIIALNVGGTANCIEALLPGMLGRGRGQIVAIGSLAAYRGLPGAAAYCAEGAGVADGRGEIAFSRQLRQHRIEDGGEFIDQRVEMLARGLSVRCIEDAFRDRAVACCCPRRRWPRWASSSGVIARTLENALAMSLVSAAASSRRAPAGGSRRRPHDWWKLKPADEL